MSPLLEVQGLTRRFGSLVAVNDVSFGVADGELLGIAGPNGAGKSVLFSLLTGFYPPTSGTITLDGEEISGMGPNGICHRGLTRTFQTATTFHTMSVRDNLRVGATFGGRSPRDVEMLLEFLALEPVAEKTATNIDLFTMKRVVLGAALASGCRVLLLDEPMAGLSHVEIESYLSLLSRLNRDWKITLLVIEHYFDILTDISDRMLILDYGRVLAEGTPEAMRDDPQVARVYLGEVAGSSDA